MARQLRHSQNFLHDVKLVESLVARSSIGPADVVYEIGPGRGIITRALALKASSIVAVEADASLYERLTRTFSNTPNVRVQFADFLQYPLPRRPYKVFANIPFNLSADIIRKLTDAATPPTEAYLVVQEEAAKKYAGAPYGRETLFSILRKPWFVFEIVHRFRRADFVPTPRVSAVLLHVARQRSPLVQLVQRSAYQDFVTHGFTSFQPTVKKAFKHVFGHVQFLRMADSLRLPVTARPSDVTLEQWLGMFAHFGRLPEPQQQLVRGASVRLDHQQRRLRKIHRTRAAGNWRVSISGER